MVKGYDYAFRVPYFFCAHLVKRLYCKHACPVVRHCIIYIRYYKIVRNRGFPGCAGEYIFTYCRHLPVIWVLEINRFSQLIKIHLFFEQVLDNYAEGELIFSNQGKT